MILKNWMEKDPLTVTGDMLASEAKVLFNQHKMPFIPVVENGRLRGILSVKDLREAGFSVTGSQSIHEMNYFNNKLKVKDLMVRKPITLSADDTVETALVKGKTFRRGFFPIIEGEKLVGAVSDREISRSLYEILGVDEKLSGIALKIDEPYGVNIKNIVEVIFAEEIELQGFFTLKDPETGKRRLLLRFETKFFERIKTVLKQRGNSIIEMVERKM